MSDFPKFNSGEEFLRYMDQLVADIEAGRHEPQPYYPIPWGSLAEAEGSLIFHRNEATRLGCDPAKVVMLRDPLTEKWTVLVPSDQFAAGLDEVF